MIEYIQYKSGKGGAEAMIEAQQYRGRRDFKHTSAELEQLQALPLERKIQIAQTRIIEWFQHFDGKVFVAFSGGKDSSVLLHLVRQLYPNVPAVFCDTGLEYPEIREIAINTPNCIMLKPAMNFRQVIQTHGFCFPSKDIAQSVYYARKAIEKAKAGKKYNDWTLRRFDGKDLYGNEHKFYKTRYAKWKFLIDAPFKISHKCCDIMKEHPIKLYERQTGNKPFIGIIAQESKRRKNAWLAQGCNNFRERSANSKPLSVWTEQDILAYILKYNIKLASPYGQIIKTTKKVNKKDPDTGKYRQRVIDILATTGESRTGCMFCPIGSHLEKVNRYQRMQITHPAQYKFCMEQLGIKEFIDWLKTQGIIIKYNNDGDLPLS